MTRLRILGLALVAVFALAAVAVSSASASPAWFECAKLKGGKYSTSSCTTPGEGKTAKYELKAGVGKNKAAKTSGTAAELVVVVPATGKGALPEGGEVKVKCTSYKGTVKAGLPNTVSDVVTEFKGCKALGSPCQSGTKKEVIKTNSLDGELVDIEGGSKTGVLLKPETGTALANFTCTELASNNVLGSVIAEQTGDVGTISKEDVDHFTIAPGLGEVEYAPGHKYTPEVNNPTHITGGTPGEHYLASEITEAGSTETHTLPSGQVAEAKAKGEALETVG